MNLLDLLALGLSVNFLVWQHIKRNRNNTIRFQRWFETYDAVGPVLYGSVPFLLAVSHGPRVIQAIRDHWASW